MSKVFECTAKNAEQMATLHASAFQKHEAWDAKAIIDLLAQPQNKAFGLGVPLQTFIIVQHIAPEAEILTLATAPDARRRGYAAELITETTKQLHVKKWLLDVAEDNLAAIALYERLGFSHDGVRANYYRRENGQTVDAVLMSLRLAGHG